MGRVTLLFVGFANGIEPIRSVRETRRNRSSQMGLKAPVSLAKMPAFFEQRPPDRDLNRVIDCKDGDRHASDVGQTDDDRPIRPEMFAPLVAPWVKQTGQLASF
jgi:hypothetical protein